MFANTLKVRSVRKRTNATRNNSKQIVIPHTHENESRLAKFYMFTYKVDEGRRRLTLNKEVYNYGPHKCPNLFNNVGRCPRGKKCHFAHGSLEILFHPLMYKTRPCTKKSACNQGKSCAWAHSNDELRVLRQILGIFWREYNPVEQPQTEKQKKRRRRNGNIRIQSIDNRSKSSASSWRFNGAPSRTATPSSQTIPDLVSVCASSVVMEDTKHVCDGRENQLLEKKETEMEEKAKEEEEQEKKMTMSEFEVWFRRGFDCAYVPFGTYLRRFEERNLDDVSFLWDMYCGMYGKFVDVLVNEIGIADGATRATFVRHLCEFKNPMDVQGWMERVVGLPQYCDLFSEYERVDELIYLGFDEDDLAEMGISLAGHRVKILFELAKFAKTGQS